MPINLCTLSNQDLFFILHCKSLKNLVKHFDNAKAAHLLKEGKRLAQIKIEKNKISKSIMTVFDVPSYPLLALWGILEVISLGFLPLTIITGGTSLLILALYFLYFFSTYGELKRKADKTLRSSQLAYLKLECADELSKRLDSEIETQLIKKNMPLIWQPKAPQLQLDHTRIEKQIEKNKWPRVRKAVGTALLVSTTIASTFYVGTSTIIMALGFATVAGAMLGPIGIAAALTVSLALGAYFGYKHYQACKNDEIVTKEQKMLDKLINEKTRKCEEKNIQLENIKSKKKKNHNANKQARPNRKLKLDPKNGRKANNTYDYSSSPMLLVNSKKSNATNKRAMNGPNLKKQQFKK